MAKYLVTSGTAFTPFTYDELVAPLKDMATAHNAAQDSYDALSTETEALREYIMREPDDSYARSLYDSYQTKLNTLQNNLWNNGYTTNTRRDLSEAKNGYANSISRLSTAIKTRQERANEYRKMKLDHPDMVMGLDPGDAALDRYLENDRYGMDWFAYSGEQFEKEVGAEIDARADELMSDITDPNGVVTNPRLAGILTRVKKEGFSNAETLMAGSLSDSLVNLDKEARYKYYQQNHTPDAVILLTESLINRYNATGIQSSDAPASERQRLLDRGKAGFSKGVRKPETKDYNDPEFAYQMELRKERDKADIDFENHKRKAIWDAEQKAAQEDATLGLYDTHTYEIHGENAAKAMDKTKDYDTNPSVTLTSKRGKRDVHNAAEASELVFGGDDAREAYMKLGFDYRLDPTSAVIGALTPENKFLGGTITIGDKEYETRYNPHLKSKNGEQGFIQYKEKGAPDTDWKVNTKATEYYKNKVKEYKKNVEYYKNNERDIYNLATIDPEKQNKDYKREGIGFDTKLTDYRSEVMHKPENASYLKSDVYVTRQSVDKGKYIDMLAGMLEDSFEFGSTWLDRGNIRKDKNRRRYTGNTRYIHKIDDATGVMESKAADPDDVFDVKDGKITNIESVQLSPEGILEQVSSGHPYMLVTTSKGTFAVDVDMFKSDRISGLISSALYGNGIHPGMLDIIQSDQLNEQEKEEQLLRLTHIAAKSLRTELNNQITQSRGGTYKDDSN